MSELFDMALRAARRDRAARLGPELFLFERAFQDCLERLALVRRSFASALLIGCPDPAWREGMRAVADRVDVRDPGPIFASRAGGALLVEDEDQLPAGAYDLVIAVATLDTVNDLPKALRSLRMAMCPDALLIGAMSGGDTLPQLRSAMQAADRLGGAASPHVHPRVEAAMVAPLLEGADFVMPVVDVDRARVAYRSLTKLVRDLRAMGATNIMNARSRRALTRPEAATASMSFAAAGDGSRTVEIFEIIHFAAWTEPAPHEGGAHP